MNKRKWLSLLLALTMLFTSIPVGMFAEGEDTAVEEPSAVEETVQEDAPAPAPEVQEEPAPEPAPASVIEKASAPAPEVQEEPAPAPVPAQDSTEELVPVAEETVPATESAEETNPATEPDVETLPATETAEEMTPVTEPTEQVAPATETTEENVATDENADPEGDPVAEEVPEEPEEEATPAEEPVPVPPADEPEEETDVFKAGLAYLSAGEVFEDKQLKNAAGTISGQAVVYATDRVTGEGEISGNDVIRIAANIDGQVATLYVKNARLSYLTGEETEEFLDKKHEDSIAYRDAKLDPVSFVAVEKPATDEESEETPTATDSDTDEVPAEGTPVNDPADEEQEETVTTTEPDTDETPVDETLENDPAEGELEDASSTTNPDADETPADELQVSENEEADLEEVPGEGESEIERTPADESTDEHLEETAVVEQEPDASPEEEDLPIDITALINPSSSTEVEPEQAEATEATEEEALEEAEGTEATEEEALEEAEGTEATEEEALEEAEETEATEEVLEEAEGFLTNGETDPENTIVITQPPVNAQGNVGDTVSFTVVASNVAGYQWQYSSNGGTRWKNCGEASATTATFTIENVTSGSLGCVFRCKLTGLDDSVEYTNTVSIEAVPVATGITIDTQPVNAQGNVGDTVSFTVVASNVSGYQWEYSSNGGTRWKNCGEASATTATLTIENITSGTLGCMFRCKLTGLDNSVEYTNTVSIDERIDESLSIDAQPVNAECSVGGTASFTVVASNVNGYQWQYSTDDGATWENCTYDGATTATMNVVNITAAEYGYLFRCMLTGIDTTVEYTNVVCIIDPDRFTVDNVTYYILDATHVRVESYSGTNLSVYIPQIVNGYTVSEIGVSAFEGSGITSIDLPNSITVIRSRAFANCSNLAQMNTH